jgi:hypothetical protein
MDVRMIAIAIASLAAVACGEPPGHVDEPGGPRVERRFRSRTFDGCLFASPLAVESNEAPVVVLASGDGTIEAIDPGAGDVLWSVTAPVPDGHLPHIVATPVAVGSSLIVAYQTGPEGIRFAHRAVVIDLDRGAVDDAFDPVGFDAELPASDGKTTVRFNGPTQLARSTLAHGRTDPASQGFVYVAFGGPADIQPWHGWLFELDLDRWRDEGPGEAIASVLVTTRESSCGVPGTPGDRDMICGGGILSPAGPQVITRGDTYEILVPTGNGQLDLARGDYANTLMRTGPGLAFDPGCDPERCADFDPIDPSRACLESCRDLFVPRMMPGDAPLSATSGVCDGLTFFECYAALDMDLGANAPAHAVLPGGREVHVMAGKDGGVYLIDAAHLGTLHDRAQVVNGCGTPADPCVHDWAGMMVTQPVVAELDGDPLVIVSTFVFDGTNPAGLVALRIASEGKTPRFEPVWQAPALDSPDATTRFRGHSGRPVLSRIGDEDFVWVVDVGAPGDRGRLLGVRVADGTITYDIELDGRGMRYARPLVVGDMLYVNSCEEQHSGPAWIEAFRISAEGETR